MFVVIVLIIIVGDMRQCLPVITKGTRSEVVAATISRAAFWQSVEVLRLSDNMRLHGAARGEGALFADWLLSVGKGDENIQTEGRSSGLAMPTTRLRR